MKYGLLLIAALLLAGCTNTPPPKPISFCQGHGGVKQIEQSTFASDGYFLCKDDTIQLGSGRYVTAQ